MGYTITCQTKNVDFFDTVGVLVPDAKEMQDLFVDNNINIRTSNKVRGERFSDKNVQLISISIDETTTLKDVMDILKIFADKNNAYYNFWDTISQLQHKKIRIAPDISRDPTTIFKENDVFNNKIQGESEMMRYIKF